MRKSPCSPARLDPATTLDMTAVRPMTAVAWADSEIAVRSRTGDFYDCAVQVRHISHDESAPYRSLEVMLRGGT